MEVDILRKKDSTELDIKGDKFGSMLVFKGTTPSDHQKLLAELKDYMDMIPVDIYFNWKTTSVFIFNFGREAFGDEEIAELRKWLNSVIGHDDFCIIMDGNIEGKNKLDGLYVYKDSSPEEDEEDIITVGINSMVLLRMKLNQESKEE